MDKLISDTEKQLHGGQLPRDVTAAEQLLAEHERKKDEIESMLSASHNEGEEIVVRVRQQVCKNLNFLPKNPAIFSLKYPPVNALYFPHF